MQSNWSAKLEVTLIVPMSVQEMTKYGLPRKTPRLLELWNFWFMLKPQQHAVLYGFQFHKTIKNQYLIQKKSYVHVGLCSQIGVPNWKLRWLRQCQCRNRPNMAYPRDVLNVQRLEWNWCECAHDCRSFLYGVIHKLRCYIGFSTYFPFFQRHYWLLNKKIIFQLSDKILRNGDYRYVMKK